MRKSTRRSKSSFGGKIAASISWRSTAFLMMLLASMLVFSGLPLKVAAADVVLDYTFGTTGVTKTDFNLADGGHAMALQPDGKIVQVGTASRSLLFAVVRYNSNGTRDSSFGSDGKVSTAMTNPARTAVARAVVIQPDGKIVAGGDANPFFPGIHSSNFALARYNTDGSLDTTFDGDGKVLTDFGVSGPDFMWDMILQPDGKIIAVGESYGINAEPYFDFSMARYNSDGSLDSTFGVGGRATANFGYGDGAKSVVLRPDGKILLGGYSRNVGTLDDYALVQFNADGTLDTTFGVGGRVVIDFVSGDSINDMALQSDGKIIAAGRAASPGADNIALVRFNADGNLDQSFGDAGRRIVSFANFAPAYGVDVVLQPDGKILLGGTAGNSVPNYHNDFAVVRYKSDGNLDLTFDGDGLVSFNLSYVATDDIANSILLQPDGKIILGGSTQGGGTSESDFAIARVQAGPRAAAEPFDYDGDGKADLAVFRPSNGGWYIRFSSNATLYGQQWGQNGDLPEYGDFDGDSRNDLVVFRNGVWYVLFINNGNARALQFGTAGDIPVAADYDGDAKADFAVFRPSSGTWYILRSSDNVVQNIQLGTVGDKPVPGDYNADGRADVAVFRPSNGTWYTSTNPLTNYDAVVWGQNGDVAVPGDYDGDGRHDRAIFRPSTATWWVLFSGGGYIEQPFGMGTDQPVPADYDGDGRTNIAIFRPSTGFWYTTPDVSVNYGAQLWGQAGDIPVESANVP